MKKYKEKLIISAGHICLDITPSFSREKSYDYVTEVLIPGHLVPIESVDIHVGGSVGNTGLALNQLGANVKLMGKIGTDEFGEIIQSQLKSFKSDFEMIQDSEGDTSYSIVLPIQGIDRIILHHSGSNNTFSTTDIDFELIKKASLFHFGYPSIMQKMYLNHGQEVISLFRKVKELGVATSLDMAIVDADSESGQMDWKAIIKEMMPYVDIFAPSVEELAFMIDRPRYEQWVERSAGQDITSVLSIVEDVKPLGEKLISWGAKVVLIKCGSLGMYLKTNTSEEMSKIGGGLAEALRTWADIEYFEKSYKPEKVVAATGAGDTSIAAFLCAILEGTTWEMALHLAAGTGASCVAAYDALSGLKSFDELIEKIEKGWEKVE